LRLSVITSFIDRSEAALYGGLRKAGIELAVICDPKAPAGQSLAEQGISVSHMTFRHRLDLRAVRDLRTRLLRERPDILYAPKNSCLSVSLMAARELGIRCVAYRGTVGHLSRWDPAAWLTYLNPRVDRIICVSKAVRRYLLSLGVHPSRLATIYKGHDISWYSGYDPQRLSDFGIPEDAFVVGFAGNMRPVKGIDVLIHAALRLPETCRIHFLLVGNVIDRKITRLARHDRIRRLIHFTGYREDAPALAGACSVFVMPSVKREGLPRALMEAMAQGVPAIVSNVGGMPEVVIDGQNGLVVPARDPDALAKAILRFAADPPLCKVFGERAQQRIGEHFNIRTTIEQTIALFRQVAS